MPCHTNIFERENEVNEAESLEQDEEEHWCLIILLNLVVCKHSVEQESKMKQGDQDGDEH